MWKHRIPKPISIQILASVIAPVVTSKIGSVNDICSSNFCDVPGVVSIIVSVVCVVEVVVVDEVVVARIIQVDAIGVVGCGVARQRVVARRTQADAVVVVRVCGVVR